MTSWYLAPSLARLRKEVNARWPDRDETSDGALGDAAHAARHSEHNPDAKGCVHALDLDKDGIDPDALVRAVVAHPATWYVIWNRRIYRRKVGFVPELYTGEDPHTGHVHVSITLSAAAETSTAPWGIEEDDMLTEQQIHDAAFAAVRDYFERPGAASLRQLEGVASSPLRLLEHGAQASAACRGMLGALAASVANLDPHGDLDPTALAQEIVRLLPSDVAQQVLDGLAQRLAS